MSQGQPVVAYARHRERNGPETGELISQLRQEVARLVRDEMLLARQQLAQKGKRAGIGGGMVSMAAVAGLYGGGAFLVAAGLGLALLIPGWAAAIVVGGGLMGCAGIAGLTGLLVLRTVKPVPAESIASVRADVRAVRDSIKR